MPSAVGSIRVLLIGGIVAVCMSMALGDDGASASKGKSPTTRPAVQQDGSVQQALRNLYVVPKASDEAGGRAPAAAAPSSAWREAGSSNAAGGGATANNGDGAKGQAGSRWSPNLAVQRRIRQPNAGQQTAGEAPNDEDMRSAGLGEPRPASPDTDRAYVPRSIGGYRGFGEYGYGRQGYSDYRRSLRWQGYSVEGSDAIRGKYYENGSYYGDAPVVGGAYGGGYGGYGGGYGGYGGGNGNGGYLPPSAGWTGDPNYGYWEYQAEARTESLLHSGLTSRDRGLAAFREGRYREAADAFRLACETNQGDPAAQLYAGHALFAIGRYHDSVKHLRRALELQPKIIYVTYDMRDDYRDKAEFQRQFAALEEALRIAPRDEDRLFMLGYVLYYGGQRDRAFEPLARLVRLNPRDTLTSKLMEACQPPDVMMGSGSGGR